MPVRGTVCKDVLQGIGLSVTVLVMFFWFGTKLMTDLTLDSLLKAILVLKHADGSPVFKLIKRRHIASFTAVEQLKERSEDLKRLRWPASDLKPIEEVWDVIYGMLCATQPESRNSQIWLMFCVLFGVSLVHWGTRDL